MKQYVRLTALVGPEARRITVWAIDLGVRRGWHRFSVVGKDGDQIGDTVRIIMGREGSADFVKVRPARMNLKYAELEVVE